MFIYLFYFFYLSGPTNFHYIIFPKQSTQNTNLIGFVAVFNNIWPILLMVAISCGAINYKPALDCEQSLFLENGEKNAKHPVKHVRVTVSMIQVVIAESY